MAGEILFQRQRLTPHPSPLPKGAREKDFAVHVVKNGICGLQLPTHQKGFKGQTTLPLSPLAGRGLG